MKKNIAKKLRELAGYIPPVVEFVPIRVSKKGSELNEIIEAEANKQNAELEAKRQAEYDALPWYEKIKLATIEHGADLGLIAIEKEEPITAKITYEEDKLYVQKRKTPKLVNHYKNLKREWEQNGQQGITDYAKIMKSINQQQNQPTNATNPTQ